MKKGNKFGWYSLPLGLVIDKISTNDKKIKQKEYLVEGKYPVIDQGADFIGGYTNDESKVLRCDLPVIVFGDHTKILKLIRYHFVPGADGVKVLLPHRLILPELLVFFVQILIRKIPDKGYARHFQYLEKSEIPIPPLPEQRAIVAKIEQLFSELDNGIACLKKAQEQLKVYRQAVLKQAFEGELTKTWREQQANLPSAQDLLDTIKAEREQTAKNQGKKLKPIKPITQTELSEWSELPDGWKWVRVDEILQSGRECGYGVLQPGENVVNGVSLIRVGDVFDGRIDYLNLKKISLDIANKYKRTFLQGGEVLITLVGAIGRTAVVPEFCKGANIARAVGVVPLSKKLNPFFVELYFRQAKKIQELTDKSHEVARKTLNLEDVKNATVIIAPLAEQEQIVQEIETRLSVCDNMEATIRESLEKAEALRQSILKKAFEGKLLSEEELTATRNDPDWEPAEKLLERIRAEKKQSKKHPH